MDDVHTSNPSSLTEGMVSSATSFGNATLLHQETAAKQHYFGPVNAILALDFTFILEPDEHLAGHPQQMVKRPQHRNVSY